MLKRIKIENFDLKIQLSRVGKYSKHELKVYTLLGYIFDNKLNIVENVYTDTEHNNVLTIDFKDGKSKKYYITGLDLR